jgi:hypothetical protein
MRDDFDTRVADRFTVLDDVAVPDIWSWVQDKMLDPTRADSTDETATTIDLDTSNPSEEFGLRRRWMFAAAAAVLLVVAAAVVVLERDAHEPAVVTNTPADNATVEASFAAAIEPAGLLIGPSADEIALASDTSLYQTESGSTQVSAADRFVSLRMCRTDPCSSGWAYETGSLDGGEVHRGLLGDADKPAVYVLDDRFFVVLDISAYVQGPPSAWLIDSLSGWHAELTWRDEPTTVSARAQELVISDGPLSVARQVRLWRSTNSEADGYVPGFFPEVFLPRVVDARDGTIRPLAVPDSASADLPVAQSGNGRIWIGTTPGGSDLGLAYSDDGGATWTEVALPAQLFADADQPANAAELASAASYNDLLLSIAADGDRIAVTDAWTSDDRDVYISSDAGLSWSTVTLPSMINGAHLYVLADERLLLVRSMDCCAKQLHVSNGSDWTTLEQHPQATQATGSNYVDVNSDGLVSTYIPDSGEGFSPSADQHQVSSDLATWRTIAVLDQLPD